MGEVVPVTFINREGARLFGVLHSPENSCRFDTAILLLSPGVKTRVAPHRLYYRMAERFVSLGYHVLRFDFYGLGDSEGEVNEEFLADLYGSIQVGRYVGDTVAAMDWMEQTYGTVQFIVSGLCGGALTGLLTASRDSRIVCLLGLSIPVIIDGSQIDFTKYMTDAQLNGMRQSYLEKVCDLGAWRSWIRFLTFQSDYRVIIRSVMKPIIAKLPFWTPSQAHAHSESADNTNPYFAPAFREVVSSARFVFLVFAEMDRLYWEFLKKFAERHTHALERYREFFGVHLTKQANHIFSFREWEEDMLEQCCKWLLRISEVRQRPDNLSETIER